MLLQIAFAYAQNGVQNVKGTIIDKQSEMPLIGANITLINEENLVVGSSTDIDGEFFIQGVPIGRHSFEVSYLGYESLVIPNVEVTSGKEVFLNITMEESMVKLNEVVISAGVDKDRSINEMATISSRQFSMEEVNRYSGGRSDVGRLAGNFAGVGTADDSRNDIVIRGNSPTGLLWRLEGIPIPSPNHFSTVGTTGGPVSALNTNLLKSSDFLTSAFPAEYGNALSGAFDLGFRSGNKDKMEYTFQVGAVTGIEAMVEGPLYKGNGSSFLIGYRYSFVEIAQAAGLDVGTNALPRYQDLSFKFDFGKTAFGNFVLFGLGGTSDIEFLRDEVDETDLFAFDDEDSGADSKVGMVGLKHNLLLDNQSYVRTVIGVSGSGSDFFRDRYYNNGLENEFKTKFAETSNAIVTKNITSFYNKKVNSRLSYRVGALVEQVDVDIDFQSAEFGIDDNQDGIFDLIEVFDFDESTLTVQPFAQGQFRINEQWTFNAGLRGLYYDLNEDFALEPRAALNWNVHPRHTINFGYGLHNQTLPLPMQLATKVVDGVKTNPNRDLGFMTSNHFVIGHDFKITDSWRSKIEVYYQDLSNIPVDKTASSFSTLNVGADFAFPIDKNDLESTGTGNNKGIELTVEKFFTNGFYFLGTGSLFESLYTGSDGVERNTAFNNRYILNVLAGKEFNWGKNKQHRFTLDTKLTTAGGKYYTPVDLEASRVNEIQVFDLSNPFGERFDPYFRWDVKFGVKLNNTKRQFSQGIYFDIQNVTDNDNIFRKNYNRVTNTVNNVYQIGFFPNFMYKIEF